MNEHEVYAAGKNVRCFLSIKQSRQHTMWSKPSFTVLRLGFEVTMYFANR